MKKPQRRHHQPTQPGRSAGWSLNENISFDDMCWLECLFLGFLTLCRLHFGLNELRRQMWLSLIDHRHTRVQLWQRAITSRRRRSPNANRPLSSRVTSKAFSSEPEKLPWIQAEKSFASQISSPNEDRANVNTVPGRMKHENFSSIFICKHQQIVRHSIYIKRRLPLSLKMSLLTTNVLFIISLRSH